MIRKILTKMMRISPKFTMTVDRIPLLSNFFLYLTESTKFSIHPFSNFVSMSLRNHK